MSHAPPSPRKTRSRARHHNGAMTKVVGVPIGLGESPIGSPALGASHSFVDAGESKKLASPRHKITEDQLQRLEELYQANTHPSRDAKETLAREIGMASKSVHIWFQNRRQDRKRKAGASPAKSSPSPSKLRIAGAPRRTPTLKPKPKRPKSHHAHKHASRPAARSSATRSDASPGSSSAGSLPSPHPPSRQRPRAPSPPIFYDPWVLAARGGRPLRRASTPLPPHLPPFPPAPVPSSAHRQWVARGAPPRPTLEWACAASAARRDHGEFVYRDEDDSAGESSEGDEGRVASGSYAQRYGTAGRWTATIPKEYKALFPPDMVLGASLLLELKYSA